MTTADRRNVGAYATLILVMLFWAGNSIVGRAVRADIPPFTLAFLRWSLAAAILLPLVRRHLRADRAVLLHHWKIVLALGVFGVAAFNAFLYSGLHHTNATNALLIQAAVPGCVLLADRLLFAQAAPIGRIMGVLLSTLGVVLVVAKADPAQLASLRLGLGDLLVLGAVAVWALYTSLLRLKPPVHPLSLVTMTFLIGALCMAPPAAMEWFSGDRPHAAPGVAAAVLYVAIFPSILSYLLFNMAVERIGPGRAGQMIALMPLFGALIAALLLGEDLHAYHLAGMALILGGIVLAVVLERRAGARPG